VFQRTKVALNVATCSSALSLLLNASDKLDVRGKIITKLITAQETFAANRCPFTSYKLNVKTEAEEIMHNMKLSRVSTCSRVTLSDETNCNADALSEKKHL